MAKVRGMASSKQMRNKIIKPRLAMAFVLGAQTLGALTVGALTLGAVACGPAFADDHGRDRDRNEQRQRYDHRGRDVYEGAPPVVIAPQGYYAQPGATLSFSLPFFR
jgi:hypothetical protein